MKQSPLDRRGYAGSERNRQLDPEDVMWARAAYASGEVSPRTLSQMWGMGIESVRRMLRGDTYGNVGEALPRANDVAQTQTVDDGGVLERLLHPDDASEVKPQEALKGEPAAGALDAFLADRENGFD